MAVTRAVFVDKDGTLVENVPYNVDPARIALTPGAADGIAALARHGYRVIVVSNQPGVALGKFRESALDAVLARLREMVPLDAFYFCPHAPDAGCACRKPAPGLLERAALEHGVSLKDSWLVGDILDDVEAGRRAGCRTLLLDNGNETEWQLTRERLPHHIACDLSQAAALILNQ
ncbi:MAG: D-glycero-alpha-D-manno-heptose-1,7-bisphosphate 7-phosphatase [Burkholderiales bacterium]